MYMNEINQQYSDHYKYIGEIKRKAEKKQQRRIRLIFVSVAVWLLIEINK